MGKTVLKNGLQVFYYPRSSNTTFGSFDVNGGSVIEPDGKKGITHLLEHAVFSGSQHYPSSESLANASEKIGLNLNAHTRFRLVSFPFEVLPQNYLRALNMVGDLVFNPLLEEKEIEKEKKIILHEMQNQKDDIDCKRTRLFNEVFFRGTPMEIPVIGIKQNVASITKSDLSEYHKANMRANNTDFFLFGKVNEKTLEETIKLLEQIKTGEKNTRKYFPLPPLQEERIERETIGINQSYGDVAFRNPLDKHLDIPAIYVMNNILNSKGRSGLWMKIREEKKLAYQIFASPFHDEFVGYSMIRFSCSPKKVDECVGIIREHITTYHPNEEDVLKSKIRLLTRFARQKNNPDIIFSQFIRKETCGFDQQYFESQVEKVTSKDIARVREKYFSGSCQIMILNPSKSDKPK